MSDKLVITGGCGFIGTHLADAFQDRYEVVLFDNFRRDSLRYAPHLAQAPRVQVVQGDVLAPASLDQALDGARAVIHLAAMAGVSTYYEQPLKTLQVNVLGTVNLLEAMRRQGVSRLIEFSTSEVYGTRARQIGEQDGHFLGPVSDRRWVYAVSKLVSEHFSLCFGAEHGMLCAVLRPFNIYGPRQTGEGAVRNFILAALRGQPLTIYGPGDDVRAWCYISDLVEATDLMLANLDQAAGQAFNVGNPHEPVTTLELAQAVLQAAGPGRIEHAEKGHTPIAYRSPSIERVSGLLGYEPKVDLAAGLRLSAEWYRENML